jgi:hypothetical protein
MRPDIENQITQMKGSENAFQDLAFPATTCGLPEHAQLFGRPHPELGVYVPYLNPENPVARTHPPVVQLPGDSPQVKFPRQHYKFWPVTETLQQPSHLSLVTSTRAARPAEVPKPKDHPLDLPPRAA